MLTSCSDIESGSECNSKGEDTYSGDSTFLCSSKVHDEVNVAGTCELLVASKLCSFALDSQDRIYFKENGRLRSHLLGVETTISGLGMTVRGHNDFVSANPGDSNIYSLLSAFNLLLSDKKLFNTAFGFPTESARIFMRPLAIRFEDDEEYEIFIPYIRVYAGGILSISLSSILGFQDATTNEVIYKEVNKSQRNINSALCERELFLASTETQISQMPTRERISQRRTFEDMIKKSLDAPEKLEFLDESLEVYELVHTDQLTLTDVARNLLSVVARALKNGIVKTHINWLGSQYHEDSIGAHWIGKPIIYIGSHSRQKNSSSENWALHKHLVNSVMSRVYLAESSLYTALDYSDMRNFDDYNSFYSEAVSLMLSSAAVESSIENSRSYTFNNLTSDIQVLNETSHYIRIYYSYASLGLERCKSAIDVARLELKILSFEESLLSAHKYGEIAQYLEEVKRGDHLVSVCRLLHKKIDTIRKALELDEKIASESYTRRITIIFGIIASATLSPELMQPLAKYYGLTFAEDHVGKIFGIGVSVAVVIGFLMITHYVFRLYTCIVQKIKT
ncbi:hypothetical protein [Pseudomonas sp. IzPS59]|uniref:hypothetical protein n=1 Tax=Pseudomonas sp. IzPS59 TaxID=2774459 RepID=UPI0017886E64|nr:hypothetical protein [Pseudomonas sp. IzPS59]